MRLVLLLVLIGVVEAESNSGNQTQTKKWLLVPAARGARNLQATDSTKTLGVIPKLITLESSRSARHSEKHPRLFNDGEFEDITRSEPLRRKVRKISRKGRRVDEGFNEKTTTDNPLRPTTAVHRLQSQRKHFVIVAPTPPESTPGPMIVQLSNGTNNASSIPPKGSSSAFSGFSLSFPANRTSNANFRRARAFFSSRNGFASSEMPIFLNSEEKKIQKLEVFQKIQEFDEDYEEFYENDELEPEPEPESEPELEPEPEPEPKSEPEPAEVAELDRLLKELEENPKFDRKSMNTEEAIEKKATRKTSFDVEIGPDFKREIEQADQSGIKVETDPSGTPTLEISPENLPEEYRKLLAKGYHSYPTFNSKNYKRPPQALFEANLLPSMNLPPMQPQFLNSNQIPIPFQPTQQNPGIQIFPGAQGNSFVIPQGVNQNVNLNLLTRARQLLALRELELIKAKQDLLLQQAKQAQFQPAQFQPAQFQPAQFQPAQFQPAQFQNRAGRAIIGQPTQSFNQQIDPLIIAELHRRQLFTAQLMQQAQQRAYYPDATFLQSGAIPQNLAPPPQIGGQFGAPFLAPITETQQQSAGGFPFQTPSATFLQNGQQMQIPVVFKRAAPK